MAVNTHNLVIDFGQFKGMRWTRVPIPYLKWLANESMDEKHDIARAELKRRGITIDYTLELSGHAINRASQITDEWKEEGVYTWLQRIGQEALAVANGFEKVEHRGFRFAFSYGNYYPILKTIMRKYET